MSSSKLKVKIPSPVLAEDSEVSRASRDFRTSFVKVAAVEASKGLETYLKNSRSFLEEDKDSKDLVDQEEMAWDHHKERISF